MIATNKTPLHNIPWAELSLMVTCTTTSLDAFLFISILPDNVLSLSVTEYCGSFNDTLIPTDRDKLKLT